MATGNADVASGRNELSVELATLRLQRRFDIAQTLEQLCEGMRFVDLRLQHSDRLLHQFSDAYRFALRQWRLRAGDADVFILHKRLEPHLIDVWREDFPIRFVVHDDHQRQAIVVQRDILHAVKGVGLLDLIADLGIERAEIAKQ